MAFTDVSDLIRRHFMAWSMMEDKTQRILIAHQLCCPFDVARRTRAELSLIYGIGTKRLDQIEMMLAMCDLRHARYHNEFGEYPGDSDGI